MKNFNYLDFQGSSGSSETTAIKPKLVAPGVKYFFKDVLRECHNYKQQNFNNVYNIGMFALFSIILGTILYSKYKGGRTAKEQYDKDVASRQYIMSKLVYYNRQNLENQQHMRNNMITNLPEIDNLSNQSQSHSHEAPEAYTLHRKIFFS